MNARRLVGPLLAVAVIVAGSCRPDCRPSSASDSGTNTRHSDESGQREEPYTLDADRASAVVDFYPELALATYRDAYERSRRFAVVVGEFTDQPTPDRLDAARQAWVAVRRPYLQSLVFAAPRADGATDPPVSDTASAPMLKRARQLDSAPGREVEPPNHTDASTSRGESRRVTGHRIRGFWAAELLLWARDTGDKRRVSDFESGDGGADSTGLRRRNLLAEAADAMVQGLESAVRRWGPGGSRRREFVETEPPVALARLVTRLRRFTTRLAAQEFRPVLDFSVRDRRPGAPAPETTLVRTAAVRGVRNVYRGTYTRTDHSAREGPGLSELVKSADPALDRRLGGALDALHHPPRRPDGGGTDATRDASESASERLHTVEEYLEAAERSLEVGDP